MHTLGSIAVLIVLFIGIWGIIALKRGLNPAVSIVAIAAFVGAILLALRTGRMPSQENVVRIKRRRTR